jgi:hypothetical protein
MIQFVDEGKLKELKKIISLEEENLPKLIQFEKENASRFYYTKLVQESEENSKFITNRIKDMEFHENEKEKIRKFIQTISSQKLEETEGESEVVKFIQSYLKFCPFQVEIFTIMIDEISKSNNIHAFEVFLNLVSVLESRETIQEVYKLSIQELTKSLDSSSFLLLQKFLDFASHILEYYENFKHFYPNFRKSLMEAPFSVGYSQFIINNIFLIPAYEVPELFHHLANEFQDIGKRESMLEFLLKILNPDSDYWSKRSSLPKSEYFFLFSFD